MHSGVAVPQGSPLVSTIWKATWWDSPAFPGDRSDSGLDAKEMPHHKL